LPLGCVSRTSDCRRVDNPAAPMEAAQDPALQSQPTARPEEAGTTVQHPAPAGAAPQQHAPAAQTGIDVAAAENAAQLFLFDNHLRGQPFKTEIDRMSNGDWMFFSMPDGFVRQDGTYVAYNVSLAPLHLYISPNGATRIETTVPNVHAPGPVNWCGLQDDLQAAAFIGRACSQSAGISSYEFVAEQELGEKGWLFQIVECLHYTDETTPDCVQSVVFVNRQGECALVFTSPESDREHPHQGNFEPIEGRPLTP
jgi:hypothetical protein